MTQWRLSVEDFGKIGSAEIEIAPLTLFVGDNNAGKSYLTSLLWGLHNYGTGRLLAFHENESVSDELKSLYKWLDEQIEVGDEVHHAKLTDYTKKIEKVINNNLEKQKKEFLRWLFNTDEVTIGKLKIEFIGEISEDIKFMKTTSFKQDLNFLEVRVGKRRSIFHWDLNKMDRYRYYNLLLCEIFGAILGLSLRGGPYGIGLDSSIYLPSSRTGFMLTKDIINQVGRENTFNIVDNASGTISPFTRPINCFLDTLSNLSLDSHGIEKNLRLADFIETEMTNGTLDISDLPNKEIRYLPKGKKRSLPLRVVSGVVTELSPLIILLKHSKNVSSIYYEEPEICLHPQLQQKMGRVICRLVNSGISVVATTHSDLIIQHINNMMRLNSSNRKTNLMSQLEYEEQDLLTFNQVKIYQFEQENKNRKTLLTEVKCGEYGFAVPTFNNALDKITNEAYEIQE